MDITKELMFKIKLKQDKYIAKINKEAKKKQIVKTNKLFTILCIISIGLIGTDIFLVNRFISLVKQI